MNLIRRIETLEKKSSPSLNVIILESEVDKTTDEALERYCNEMNITEAELEANNSLIIHEVYVSPEDIY